MILTSSRTFTDELRITAEIPSNRLFVHNCMSRAAVASLALLFAFSSLAEEPQQKFAENVSVGYVMVPFTVFGETGAPLTDVRSRDVSLFVDGERVKSDMF